MNRSQGLVALMVGALSGIALAQATQPQRIKSPGWDYGDSSCGCLANEQATKDSCNACCQAAFGGLQPDWTQGQLTNCRSFCSQAVFPCYRD